MRKVIIFIMLLVFNFLFIYGINYANRIMLKNNFMIYLREKKENNPEKENETPQEETIIYIDYDGESIEQISAKFENVFRDTYLSGYGEYMVKNSMLKGVNPYLIGGIILESTKCRRECSVLLKQCNNVSGMREKEGSGCFGGTYKYYSSIDDGIIDLINKISKDYYSVEMQTPNKMFKQYGKDATWAFIVSKYMDELRRGS